MNKSAQVRELFDQGKSVSEIARELNTYYSFVYRVIERYTGEKPPTRGRGYICEAVKKLLKQNKDVSDIMKELGFDESRRGYVYTLVRRYKKEGY